MGSNTFITMLRILRPILMTFVKTNAVKKLILDLLKALVKTTDNTIDDQIVNYVEVHLWPNNK
ncbi:MAG: hypothetical protein Unbinned1007contig1000_5 [Prokaryotic dsDNA virus sp.]|nr:MAG: hypothetical protein Unbinned1007contig1000_5 [Prokaryotic dsDNA virus sp.]